MGIIPYITVPAPEPRGLRYGLLTAANGPLDLPDHARAGGIQYKPVSCGHAHTYPPECGPDEDTPTEKTFDPADDTIQRNPFIVYATYVCGTVGYTADELTTYALRRLANGEQTEAERALADIMIPAAAPLPAPDITDVVSVVGELEQWLYGGAPGEANYGNVGYLHASPRMAAYFSDRHVLEQDSNVWRTKNGTIVVFGGGYPDGTLFITGQVTVWRSPDVFVYPPDRVLDRETNQYLLVAEREYVVSYDCLVGSSPIDVWPTS